MTHENLLSYEKLVHSYTNASNPQLLEIYRFGATVEGLDNRFCQFYITGRTVTMNEYIRVGTDQSVRSKTFQINVATGDVIYKNHHRNIPLSSLPYPVYNAAKYSRSPFSVEEKIDKICTHPGIYPPQNTRSTRYELKFQNQNQSEKFIYGIEYNEKPTKPRTKFSSCESIVFKATKSDFFAKSPFPIAKIIYSNRHTLDIGVISDKKNCISSPKDLGKRFYELLNISFINMPWILLTESIKSKLSILERKLLTI